MLAPVRYDPLTTGLVAQQQEVPDDLLGRDS